MNTTQNTTDNPLATGNINQLMIKFAVPSIIAMMVSAVYNIADQLFIGNAVGTLGNAATNIAFPLSMMCTAIALMFGIGGASSFNLHMGAGESQKAPYFLGNSITMLLGLGAILFIGTELFLDPMLKCFGSPDNGFPFLILATGGGHLIRADGSPKMTMICNLSGAIINIVLDALFVLVLRWGMVGAALATIIGQIFSAFLALNYLRHYRTVTIEKKHLRPQTVYLKRIMALGMASCFNQIAMMTVQICMNNLLKHYGSLSQYGEAIPIACAGIVMKVGQLYFSIVIGLSQGSQPIESFNYGARQYKRVKAAYRYAVIAGGTVSVIAFVIFQLFPHQLLALFGNGSKEYFEFGSFYFRIFMLMAWANFMQPISSTFFTSIGKANKGTFLSLTRQIIFLLPLMFFLPTIFGIKGILYAAPIADGMAFVTAVVMVWSEMRAMK